MDYNETANCTGLQYMLDAFVDIAMGNADYIDAMYDVTLEHKK